MKVLLHELSFTHRPPAFIRFPLPHLGEKALLFNGEVKYRFYYYSSELHQGLFWSRYVPHTHTWSRQSTDDLLLLDLSEEQKHGNQRWPQFVLFSVHLMDQSGSRPDSKRPFGKEGICFWIFQSQLFILPDVQDMEMLLLFMNSWRR